MLLRPGIRPRPHEIVAPLGESSVSEVRRARDTRLRRVFAIAFTARRLSSVDDMLARFEREPRTLAQLNHPHIRETTRSRICVG